MKVFLVDMSAYNRAAIVERCGINKRYHVTNPMKALTCLAVVSGVGYCMRVWTLSGCVAIPLADIRWPRNSTSSCKNSHLLSRTWYAWCCSFPNTKCRCSRCSSQVWLKIRMSSMYTTAQWSQLSKARDIAHWKVGGAFRRPNGITSYC